MKRKRAATVHEVLNTKFKELEFDGEFRELFGKPERSGCWIIWGESANGKTAFTMQLAKYLCRFGRVAYNSLEEGISLSLKGTLIREGMMEQKGRFLLLDKEPIDELHERLKRRKSPDVVIIDSIQYSGLTKITAKQLINEHPSKLFIFVSHAAGKLPDGRTANSIRYDANVKVRVEGFRAWIESRYGGDKRKYYTIYPDGANAYWGDEPNNE